MTATADQLFRQGVEAAGRGDFRGALRSLEAARAASPNEAIIPLTIAAAHRRLGDVEAERAGIDAALVADPYFLPGLLARGEFLERTGRPKSAVVAYRAALTVAPPEAAWPASFRAALTRARQVTEADSAALATHLEAAVSGRRDGLSGPERERWAEAVAIMAGRSRPYTSHSNQLLVPRLPAIPFFERSAFPWATALEAKTDAIRAELQAVMASGAGEFTPYIAYRPGDPVGPWAELNHSLRWSTFHLWRGGEPVAENLARCPQTAAALEAAGMAQIEGLCPNAMFSVLAPGAHIPPHTGETNARLVVHLPLIVPEGCSYRVGFERRRWTEGQVLVFDDTLEHEARNDGTEPRVVLIFDTWNPLLSEAERGLVQTLTAASRAFAAER